MLLNVTRASLTIHTAVPSCCTPDRRARDLPLLVLSCRICTHQAGRFVFLRALQSGWPRGAGPPRGAVWGRVLLARTEVRKEAVWCACCGLSFTWHTSYLSMCRGKLCSRRGDATHGGRARGGLFVGERMAGMNRAFVRFLNKAFSS